MAEKYVLETEMLNGVYDGTRHRFTVLPVTIGRASENNIAIPFDTAASRAHARIISGEVKNTYFILDQNSTNGTFVNENFVKDQAVLRAGDIIKIGDTLIKCITVG
ncbi:MAG: FHA domain-containing protein [Candidatus Eremiobacteraeota bacterium]|nr:FHA domain-containing protein [Candidatus Eremiobacteraeota bacterium]